MAITTLEFISIKGPMPINVTRAANADKASNATKAVEAAKADEAAKAVDAKDVVLPYLPPELWAMIYEEAVKTPCKGWVDRIALQKWMLGFRLVSRVHNWAAWSVFGRKFFSSRHVKICPTCPVKDRPELTHPIISRYMRHVSIDLIEECQLCMEEKMERSIRYPKLCCYNVLGCTCSVNKYPVWDPLTDPEESEMDLQDVLRQVDLVMALPALKHVEFEPDDHFRRHYPQLIKDVVTSIALWSSPTDQVKRTLSISLDGVYQCPIPAVALPPGHHPSITALNIDFSAAEARDRDMDLGPANKLLAAFPALAKLRLNCQHHLPLNWVRGQEESFGPHTSLKELQITSEHGIVFGDADEFVGLISMFPNLTTLCLAANVLWGDNHNDSWQNLFQGAVAVSKLSRLFYTPGTTHIFDHLLTQFNIGWHAEFPSEEFFADLGITAHGWSWGPPPTATRRPGATLNLSGIGLFHRGRLIF
jgi:hypothetical protein